MKPITHESLLRQDLRVNQCHYTEIMHIYHGQSFYPKGSKSPTLLYLEWLKVKRQTLLGLVTDFTANL